MRIQMTIICQYCQIERKVIENGRKNVQAGSEPLYTLLLSSQSDELVFKVMDRCIHPLSIWFTTLLLRGVYFVYIN